MTHICANIKLSSSTASEVAKKIRLERIFQRELIPAFRQILRDYRVTVASFGRPQNAEQYEPMFNGLLLKNYDRTQRAFKGEVADQNGGKALFMLLTKQTERAEALVDFALLEWRNNNAEQKSGIITDTNQRQMDEALTQARADFAQREEPVTPTALATVATIFLARKFNVRKSTIAQTETQEAAESTKQIEASVAAGKTPFSTQPTFIDVPEDIPDITKTWDDFGDNRVRITHRAANGTTLPEDGIFTVGGSRLLFPGDTSLQANIKETIRCRCSSVYKVQ